MSTRSRVTLGRKDDRTRYRVVMALNPLAARSHLARQPTYSSNDVDLLATAFVGLVDRIVGDDPNSRRIAVGDVLQPLGDQSHAVVKHEYTRRSWRAPAEIDQHDVAIVKCRHHAVALDMHDA